jgi:hypothetical protein
MSNKNNKNNENKSLRDAMKSRGLGDTVSKTIKKLSGGKVKECEACKKRKEKWNKLFPYKGDKG